MRLLLVLSVLLLVSWAPSFAQTRCEDAFTEQTSSSQRTREELEELALALKALQAAPRWTLPFQTPAERAAIQKIFPIEKELNENFVELPRNPTYSAQTIAFAKHGLEQKSAELARKGIVSVPFTALNNIHQRVSDHHVAGLAHLKKYDPDGCKGFCYGRAMAAHLEAIVNHGVDPRNILKVFAVGRFEGTDAQGRTTGWIFHVTTIIRGEDGQWYAIDPRLDGPVTINDWITYWRQFDSQGDMSLFVTSPTRISTNPAGYGRKVFKSERYFQDLLEAYRQDALRLIEQLRASASRH